jgi:hypothetical protein
MAPPTRCLVQAERVSARSVSAQRKRLFLIVAVISARNLNALFELAGPLVAIAERLLARSGWPAALALQDQR